MKTLGIILTAVLMSAAASAQTPPPKPGPELKKLDMFVGTWSLDGTMKPGMMGPGCSMTESEKCEWMGGGFYVICHSDYKSSMGTAWASPCWDTPPTTKPTPTASSTASANLTTPAAPSMATLGLGPATKRWKA